MTTTTYASFQPSEEDILLARSSQRVEATYANSLDFLAEEALRMQLALGNTL